MRSGTSTGGSTRTASTRTARLAALLVHAGADLRAMHEVALLQTLVGHLKEGYRLQAAGCWLLAAGHLKEGCGHGQGPSAQEEDRAGHLQQRERKHTEQRGGAHSGHREEEGEAAALPQPPPQLTGPQRLTCRAALELDRRGWPANHETVAPPLTLAEVRDAAAAELNLVLLPRDAPPEKLRGLREGWVHWYVGDPVRHPDDKSRLFNFDEAAGRFVELPRDGVMPSFTRMRL